LTAPLTAAVYLVVGRLRALTDSDVRAAAVEAAVFETKFGEIITAVETRQLQLLLECDVTATPANNLEATLLLVGLQEGVKAHLYPSDKHLFQRRKEMHARIDHARKATATNRHSPPLDEAQWKAVFSRVLPEVLKLMDNQGQPRGEHRRGLASEQPSHETSAAYCNILACACGCFLTFSGANFNSDHTQVLNHNQVALRYWMELCLEFGCVAAIVALLKKKSIAPQNEGGLMYSANVPVGVADMVSAAAGADDGTCTDTSYQVGNLTACRTSDKWSIKAHLYTTLIMLSYQSRKSDDAEADGSRKFSTLFSQRAIDGGFVEFMHRLLQSYANLLSPDTVHQETALVLAAFQTLCEGAGTAKAVLVRLAACPGGVAAFRQNLIYAVKHGNESVSFVNGSSVTVKSAGILALHGAQF
jgi:hypothetical protein